ncbi:hypothetical protein WAK64_07015 [Bacillus spongiae]|uniref:DUF3221 domain-containing protein n=1 Tax=Bacillus spongiae TaxID=2683610 RepID=A0ABU8HC99_9BACI
MKNRIIIISVVILSLAVPIGSLYFFNYYMDQQEKESRFYVEGTIVKKEVDEDVQFTIMKSLLVNGLPEEIDKFIDEETIKGNIVHVKANPEFEDITVGEKVRVYFVEDELAESGEKPPFGEAEDIERFK